MIVHGLLALLAATSSSGRGVEDDLERRLSDRSLAVEAAAELRDHLPADELPSLLERLPGWSPQAQLAARQALVESARLRRGLLARCLEGNVLAREILVAQRLARLDETLPWSDGVAVRRQRAEITRPPGLRLRFRSSPGRGIDLAELLLLLEETGSLAAPVVVHPACRLEDFMLCGDGLPRSAEWWLEESLAGAGCAAVRLLQSTWIVPAEQALEADDSGDLAEWQRSSRMRDREARWLDGALRWLGELPEPRRSWRGLLLCEQVGLPCGGEDPAAQVHGMARGRRSFGEPVPAPPPPQAGPAARRYWARACVRDGAEPPGDPAVAEFVATRRRGRAPEAGSDEGPGPATEEGEPAERARELRGAKAEELARRLARDADASSLLAILAELCGTLDDEAEVAATEAALSWLRWVIAARAEQDALLAGRARAAVRQAARDASGPAVQRLEAQARCFWRLGACARPVDRWVDLDEWGWLPLR